MDGDWADRELEAGETVRYTGGLRRGEGVAVTDSRVLVRSADELLALPYENVSEITTESVDWFLALLSLALTGVGLVSLIQGRNPLLAVGFTLVGLWSLRRTYRHRDRVRIHLHSQPKPVTIFPVAVDDLYPALEEAIAAVREDRA